MDPTSSFRFSYGRRKITQPQRYTNRSFVTEKKAGNGDGAMQGLCEPEAKRLKAIDILDDILEEVLLRLPVKSLMRFKSVCKSWRDTIGSLDFERRQLLLARARRPSMLILPLRLMSLSAWMDKIRFFAYPGHGKVAELMHEKLWSPGISSFTQPMHCDGLVVVAAAHSSQIFVCNPATKELVLLPAGSPDYSYGFQKVGFGVDTLTGKYKVVRCFWRYCNGDMTEYSIGCEIFTLGSLAWRPVADPPYLIKSMTPACLQGAIYWSAGITVSTQVMLRFNLHDEEFTLFPAPPCMELADDCSNLTVLDGKLGYAHITGHGVQVWVAEDDGVQLPKWLHYLTIVPPWPNWSMMPFSAYQGIIYLCSHLTHLYRYDTKSKSLEQVVNWNKLHPSSEHTEPLYSWRLGLALLRSSILRDFGIN